MKSTSLILLSAAMLAACSNESGRSPNIAPPITAPKDQANREVCEHFAGIAKNIMKGRQNGQEMQAAMAWAAQQKLFNQTLQVLVVAAYEKPRYASSGRRQEAVADFGNGAYLDCVKGQGILK